MPDALLMYVCRVILPLGQEMCRQQNVSATPHFRDLCATVFDFMDLMEPKCYISNHKLDRPNASFVQASRIFVFVRVRYTLQ